MVLSECGLCAIGPDGRLVRNQLRPSGKHGFLVEYTPHLAGIGCNIISQLTPKSVR